MNPETFLSTIEQLIKERQASACKSYHLCRYQTGLAVRPKNHTMLPHTVYFVFTEAELHTGLTVSRWNELSRKMAPHIKETYPCLTELKP